MRRVFAVGRDCPKLSGTAVTVGFPGETAESVISGWVARSWRKVGGVMLMSDGAEIPMRGE